MFASPPPHSAHAPSSFNYKSSRSRKHSLSLSNPMGWLSRTSTQSSASSAYAPSKPTRIPEPHISRSIQLLSARTGPLGSGATVVRTPDEALKDTGIRLEAELRRSCSSVSSRPLHSPPLPDPPAEGSDDEDGSEDTGDDRDEQGQEVSFPPRPTRACPPPPIQSPLRPSLKAKSRSSNDVSQVPPLPLNAVPSSPPQPPFQPLLMSPVPSPIVDRSKVIVTLETCTATYRTTLDTITSRPSHLSAYLLSLFPRPDSLASSIYSTDSDDMSSYRHHLASQGLLSQAPVNLHVFLDRPSAPYAHILSYLRSPAGAQLGESLPRAVQLLPSQAQSRLEALLELRDEASYLDLDDLYKLCSEEIRQRQPRMNRTHSRGQSSHSASGIQSQHASVYSLPTLHRSESHKRARHLSTVSSSSTKVAPCSPDNFSGIASSPTPDSWKTACRNGSRSPSPDRNDVSRSPPAGWI